MKLRSGRRIVRRKNIYLPTEVWVDILCFAWITRWKLAQMIDKIGNRWFGEQLQFYLHEWGKHTMGHLRFTSQLEYPQTAMPENIKFFESFDIEHFDNQIYNFFRRIQSVFTADTKLEIRYIHKIRPRGYSYFHTDPKDVVDQLRNARTIFGHLLPLIDGVRAVYTDDRMLPIVKSFPAEKFHQIKVLDVHFDDFVQSAMQPIVEWLTASSNEPKLLQLTAENDIAQQVLETIRKYFMDATETKPLTFAVLFTENKFPAFNCKNALGEQLCGSRSDQENDDYEFKVFRHQANAEAGDKLRQWVDANKVIMYGWKQCIRLDRPKIEDEPIFALQDEDEADNNEKEDDDEKPCTSKKRRICK